MRINKELLKIFRYTYFESKFKYCFDDSNYIEMSESLRSKQMVLRSFTNRNANIMAKVFIKLNTSIMENRMLKDLNVYTNNIINIYNLYLLSREYIRVNK